MPSAVRIRAADFQPVMPDETLARAQDADERVHAAIARAIAAGDQNAAGAASDRLLDYIQAFTRNTID